jgi:hypothetical protein
MHAYATLEILPKTAEGFHRGTIEMSAETGEWLGSFTAFGNSVQDLKDRAYTEADLNANSKGYKLNAFFTKNEPIESKFKVLDDAILLHLKNHPQQHPIYNRELNDISAKVLGRTMNHGDDKEWRLIDRRLQALRKEGKIAPRRTPMPHWVLV